MSGIDIATLNTRDSSKVGALVDAIRQHLDAEQCVDFLAALYKWDKVRDSPTLPQHADYMREFQEWRQFVLEVTAPETSDRWYSNTRMQA